MTAASEWSRSIPTNPQRCATGSPRRTALTASCSPNGGNHRLVAMHAHRQPPHRLTEARQRHHHALCALTPAPGDESKHALPLANERRARLRCFWRYGRNRGGGMLPAGIGASALRQAERSSPRMSQQAGATGPSPSFEAKRFVRLSPGLFRTGHAESRDLPRTRPADDPLIGLLLSCRLASPGRAPRRSFEPHGGTERGRESRGRV